MAAWLEDERPSRFEPQNPLADEIIPGQTAKKAFEMSLVDLKKLVDTETSSNTFRKI